MKGGRDITVSRSPFSFRFEHKEDAMETSVSYCGGDHAYFSSDEHRWCNRIVRLAADHPDDVEIIRPPEQNDGCVYARIPASWLRIQPKFTRNYTDEQRAMFSKNMKKMRAKTKEDA